MGFFGFHHVGTFLLFACAVLLIVSSISAPTVSHLAFLRINLANSSRVDFGPFGYSVLDTRNSGNYDSSTSVGYDIAEIITQTTGVSYSSSSLDSATKGLVLNPVAAGVAFLAFLVAAASHRIGFLFAAFVAAIAWIITLAALIVDLFVFIRVKHQIDNHVSGASASYREGIWTTVAAFIVLFFAAIATCFSCFTDRRDRKRGRV